MAATIIAGNQAAKPYYTGVQTLSPLDNRQKIYIEDGDEITIDTFKVIKQPYPHLRVHIHKKLFTDNKYAGEICVGVYEIDDLTLSMIGSTITGATVKSFHQVYSTAQGTEEDYLDKTSNEIQEGEGALSYNEKYKNIVFYTETGKVYLNGILYGSEETSSVSTILEFTVENVYRAHQGYPDLSNIDTISIVRYIDEKEQIYIHYDGQKRGIIPCGTYRDDEGYYYILFIADNNVFKLHIVDSDTTVYIDSIINLEDIKAEITVDDQLSEGSTNPVQNKVITTELKKKANTEDIPTRLLQLTNDANYATTTYVDGKIPTKTSELTNNSGFITSEEVQEEYQHKGNYITEEILEGKSYITDVDAELSDDSENPVQNKTINAELKKKIEGEIEYVLPVSGMGVVPKDLVLATPSGDPMHYMYIAAGADYNATESDIEVPGEYGDTIFHEKGRWYLNEVGDLTNEEMRLIYEDGFHTRKPNGGYPMFFQGLEYRTLLNRTDFQDPVRTTYSFSYCTKALVIRIGKNTTTIYQPTGMFSNCERVIKILGVMRCAPQITDFEIGGMFAGCYALQEVKLKDLHRSISLKDSNNISKNSILYMINNAVKSENKITITLHEDAYNRLIDDEEINNAISTHGNIELSKPEIN